MNEIILIASLIPLAGTLIGSASVFFLKNELPSAAQRSMSGFAAGVMCAASVWSLLIPAMEQSENLGGLSWLPAAGGFWIGVLFLLLMDRVIPHIHPETMEQEGPKTSLKKRTMLMLAVTLHNVPEGMAVGATLAGLLSTHSISQASVLALAIGIAIQNAPEGAIISLPLHAGGASKGKAFLFGTLSGAVEPIATWITLLFSAVVAPALPWFLGFAAGAMMYVVIEELIPEMASGSHSNLPALAFSAGFTLMMILDVALG